MEKRKIQFLIVSLGSKAVGKSITFGLFEPTVNEMLKKEHEERLNMEKRRETGN